MTSAILSGLVLDHTDSYSYGTKPYRLVFASRDDLGNTGGVGATPYGLVFVVNTVGVGATPYGLVFFRATPYGLVFIVSAILSGA